VAVDLTLATFRLGQQVEALVDVADPAAAAARSGREVGG